MTTAVSYRRQGDIGVLRIANPPVNALSQAVRAGLLEALAEGLADPEARALVLLGDGRTFIAGADIREFGKPPQPPLLGEVIRRLEDSPKPIVAALHGHALGGGLEVALGCHARIALPGTRLGLPEVKLGLLPGAGGTQRLPRLTGLEAALELITTGRPIQADQARQLGIVDAVGVDADPEAAGLALAREILAGRRPARRSADLPAPVADPEALARHRRRLAEEHPYLFSPFRILEAVEASARLPLDEGLAEERELFTRCMASPQRAGLIHVFFAARGTRRVPGASEAEPFTRLALLGEHPWFDELRRRAGKAGIALVDAPDDACLACLVDEAAGEDAWRQAEAAGVPVVGVAREAVPRPRPELAASLRLIPAPQGVWRELLDLDAGATTQQAIAESLGRLRQSLVVSRHSGLLIPLRRALEARLAEAGPGEIAGLARLGWTLMPPATMETAPTPAATETVEALDRHLRRGLECAARALSRQQSGYRASDIDLLAVEGLGYPRHLGGPLYQAEVRAASEGVYKCHERRAGKAQSADKSAGIADLGSSAARRASDMDITSQKAGFTRK